MKLNAEAPEAPFILSFRKDIITTNAGLMILSVSMRHIWDSLSLTELFTKALPNFSYYGLTEVSPDDFKKLKELSKGSEQWENVISQLSPWAEECFENNTVFTICGI